MLAVEPRKKPQQRRSEETVSAILEATSRVLLRHGAGGITTTRVADTAGVGVGTLYQYFPNKEALVHALLQRNMRELEEAILGAAARSEGASFDARIEVVIDALLAHKAKRADLSAALRAQLSHVDGVRVVRATIRRIEAGVRELLRHHVAEDELDISATLVTSAVDGAMTAALDNNPRLVKSRAFRDGLVRLVRGYVRATR